MPSSLAAELEETRQLNEQLKKTQNALVKGDAPQEASDTQVLLSGTTNESVSLNITDLLYIEAVGNYVKVCHLRDGQVQTDMLRATMKQTEETLQDYPMIVRYESLPVSRSNMAQVRAAILHERTSIREYE